MKRVLNFMRSSKLAHIVVVFPLDEPEKMPSTKKYFQEDGQKPLSYSQTAK